MSWGRTQRDGQPCIVSLQCHLFEAEDGNLGLAVGGAYRVLGRLLHPAGSVRCYCIRLLHPGQGRLIMVTFGSRSEAPIVSWGG